MRINFKICIIIPKQFKVIYRIYCVRIMRSVKFNDASIYMYEFRKKDIQEYLIQNIELQVFEIFKYRQCRGVDKITGVQRNYSEEFIIKVLYKYSGCDSL